MYYYKEIILENGWILSCDNARIEFVLRPEYAQEFVDRFCNSLRIDIYNYPVNTTFAKYKRLMTVTYAPDMVCTIALGFNGATKIDIYGYDNDLKGYIDFNPNKLGAFDLFWDDYDTIRSLCGMFECKRCDIALDVPYPRNMVLLKKDNRVFSEKVYSKDNKTEYLGLRNQPGRVKIYNKALEQKLPCNLTRIEVTTEPNGRDFLKHFPDVYIYPTEFQVEIGTVLSENDLVLLDIINTLFINGLDDGLILFNSLTYRKRKKLEKYLFPETSSVGRVVNNFDVNTFFASLRKEVLRL